MKFLLATEPVEAALLPYLEKLTIFAAEYERTSDSGQKRGKPFPAFKVAGVAAFSGGAQRQGASERQRGDQPRGRRRQGDL